MGQNEVEDFLIRIGNVNGACSEIYPTTGVDIMMTEVHWSTYWNNK